MKQPGNRGIWVVAALLMPAPQGGAATVDESQLPAPAPQQIDFARDIKPILADNCLRCHGAERPKSNFRLTDRAAALKGGANGVDLIPGNSAKSRLIHYTARLVPDLEMPPEGKGQPLSTNQVSRLRAWIDQGAVWDAAAAAPVTTAVTATPVVGWTAVHGDTAKFRELEWQPESWNGGLQDFDLRRSYSDGRTAEIAGHVLRDDYKLGLELRKPDLGFARLGFEQFRKYYDDSGGYDAGFSPSIFRLGQDPGLDIGRAWTEVGFTLPNWPRLVVGYEFQFKDGSKSMLTWGSVDAPNGNFSEIRNIYPSAQGMNEHTHVVRLDAAYDTHGFQFENNLRLEFYASDTRRSDALNVPAGQTVPDLQTQVHEQHSYTQATDTLSLQKELAKWWLAGLGYRYSWLDGDAAFGLTPQDGTGAPAPGSTWSANKIVLSEVWQVFNAYSQFRPFPNFTATAGVQAQWKQQQTFGDVNMDEVVDPTDPTSGTFRFPATERSTLDQTTAEESFLVRYTGLPFTSLYAEARLKQESWVQLADQDNGPHAFALDENASVRWQEYRAGFNTSPWRWISFGGSYRHRDRTTDYAYPQVQGDTAYPGFILARAIVADEIEPRVVLHPVGWLKATLSYQLPVSDYRTSTGATDPAKVGLDATPGGTIQSGRYQAHVLNASATFTPSSRLFLSAALGYQQSRTTTASNGNPSVVPYEGDLWSGLASATYVLDQRTDATVNYVFSQARYGQHNASAGLPLGLDYDRHGMQLGLARRFSKSVTGRLVYGYFTYAEPSSGHLHDYRAQQVLAVANYSWR